MTLDPCRHCQASDAELFVNAGWFAVECNNCDYRTGAFRAADEAIAAWNTRSASPAPEGWRTMESAPSSVYDAVERALDEASAWISRPSKDVTRRVALAATAAYHVLAQKAAGEALEAAEAEIERVRPSVCDTFTVLNDGPFTRREGRISEDGLNKLHEAVLTLASLPAAPVPEPGNSNG